MFTLTEIEEMIVAHKAAILAVLKGQSYNMNTGQGQQSVTRADLDKLYRSLGEWESRRLDALAGDNGNIVSLQTRGD